MKKLTLQMKKGHPTAKRLSKPKPEMIVGTLPNTQTSANDVAVVMV